MKTPRIRFLSRLPAVGLCRNEFRMILPNALLNMPPRWATEPRHCLDGVAYGEEHKFLCSVSKLFFMPRCPIYILFLFLSAVPLAEAQDIEAPLWELGAMLAVAGVPHYPSSDENRFEAIPLPYFAYRGRTFRSDENGLLRGRLLISDRAELDISLAGALATNSSDIQSRSGMPDLDWMVEIGPRLEVTLAQAVRHARIDFELPLRTILSTDFSGIDHVGLISVPEIAYQHENLHGAQVKFGLGITFADQRYQDLLYGVPERYATVARPTYRAQGGYFGSRLQFSFRRRINPTMQIISAARINFYAGAVNEDSPLFRRQTTASVGLVLVWTMLRSVATAIE